MGKYVNKSKTNIFLERRQKKYVRRYEGREEDPAERIKKQEKDEAERVTEIKSR